MYQCILKIESPLEMGESLKSVAISSTVHGQLLKGRVLCGPYYVICSL